MRFAARFPRSRTCICLASVAMLTLTLGCREDLESPTGPEAEPPPSTTVLPAVTNLSFTQIRAGADFSCGRTMTAGKLYCWGNNSNGQLGNASLNNKKRPTPVSSTLQFSWVSAGPGHTCAIATDAKAYCWGANVNGQLGDGTTTARWSPTLVSGGLSWKQIEVGGYAWDVGFTCGLTTGNLIYCWGDNDYGQLGLGFGGYPNMAAVPVQTTNIGVTYRQLTTGGAHTCAVSTANVAYCWGDASYGQTGNGGIYYRPTAVSGGLAFRQVTAGAFHTCGTTTGNKAYCWGNGQAGELGNGTTTDRFAPRAVSGSLSYSRVFAGAFHTCGLTLGQKAYCWGFNYPGRLGDGTTTSRLAPVAVQTGVRFAQMGLGGEHTCAVEANTGRGYCWGDNTYGEVGDATTISPRLTPTRVAGAP